MLFLQYLVIIFMQIPLEEDNINMELECTHLQHKPCSSLPYPCISCQKMNDSCIYGNQTIATCNANVHCQVSCIKDIILKFSV